MIQRRQSIQGMTLIELLVVIVIIAVLVVGVGLSIGLSERGSTKGEAERLAMSLETLSLSARTTGKKFAWSFGAAAYQFWEQAASGEWTVITQNTDFLPRTLPEAVRITDALWEGQPVAPGQRIVFSMTPPILNLSMSGTDARYRILATPAGSIRANLDAEELRKR
jgi:type II secretion system protein H